MIGVAMQVLPRRGQRYVLAVRPLDWYAGRVGVGAVVEECSDSAVYVVFDGGLRESFPPARFVEYFQPEEKTTNIPSAHPAGAIRQESKKMPSGAMTPEPRRLPHVHLAEGWQRRE